MKQLLSMYMFTTLKLDFNCSLSYLRIISRLKVEYPEFSLIIAEQV